MAEQGSKGSKGPDKVVPGKDGNTPQTTSESRGMVPAPSKPGGTHGTKPGAR
jgi:hypothetical protein